MPHIFCDPMGVPFRLYLHQNDDKAAMAAPAFIRQITNGGGALVSDVEDAQCVLIVEPSEKNAIRLHKTLAESDRNVPVLKADWVSASTRGGRMLGPNSKPSWGGFLLKYYRDAQEFFNNEPTNIKKEDLQHEPEVIIILTDSEDDSDGEDEPRRLPRNVRVLEDPRTAAQILRAIAKDLKKYKLEDLVRMVKALKGKRPGDITRVCEELAAVYQAAGKDYGIGGNSWLGLLRRNRELYETCMEKIRQGDKSLGDLAEKESSLDDPQDLFYTPGASPAGSASLPESSKSGRARVPVPTSPAAFQNPFTTKGNPSASHSFNPQSLAGIAGSSKPRKRAFTTIRGLPSDSEDDSEQGGSTEPNKRSRY